MLDRARHDHSPINGKVFLLPPLEVQLTVVAAASNRDDTACGKWRQLLDFSERIREADRSCLDTRSHHD